MPPTRQARTSGGASLGQRTGSTTRYTGRCGSSTFAGSLPRIE
jgi:hypothetical protein